MLARSHRIFQSITVTPHALLVIKGDAVEFAAYHGAMMTVHKLSAGEGYRYYTQEVASADSLRDPNRQLGDYYTVDGLPPGLWVGAGVKHLGVSGEVTEQQMKRLFGEGLHPDFDALRASGDPEDELRLGRKYPEYSQADNEYTKRLAEELNRHKRTTGEEPTKEESRLIRGRVAGGLFREMHGRDAKDGEELGRFISQQSKPAQQAVAGYDLVFTPTKSVSVAWGLGDEQLRQGIEAAHEKAIADALGYLEDNAVYTRRGTRGVRQVDVDGGLVATKFRHYDSRTGDPNLHDHVVIANKVKGTDGKWSSLDGRMLYQHNVAASEVYNSRIVEHLHRDLGLEFTPVQRRGGVIYELAGINSDTIGLFSSRRSEIAAELEQAEAKFIERHGHAPTDKQRIALAQHATLATREAKDKPRSLAELNQMWREKADRSGIDIPTGGSLHEQLKQASTLVAEDAVLASAKVHTTLPAEHAQEILARLEESRSTWRMSNVEAEARRYFREVSAATSVDPGLLKDTLEAVKGRSVAMTPALDLPIPNELRRADGTSMYQTANAEMFTSDAVIAAEARVVEAATTQHVIPVATTQNVANVLDAYEGPASESQIAMARGFATNEKLLAVGIGPAGAGKTTSSKLLLEMVDDAGGTVYGLAPTSAAASVMSNELGIKAETIDKFLHMAEKSTVGPGDVLLVDEIGMVTTPKLSALLDIAEQRGAVVRGMGDYRQLAAIGAGGALRLIDREAETYHLEDVFRFRNPDEANASLTLREPALVGEDKPFQWYIDNHRVEAGAHDVMTNEVFRAWVQDTQAGKNSLMLAPTNQSVTELNELGQAYAAQRARLDTNQATTTEAGTTIYGGDLIVTRQNARFLRVNGGKDFVKNGDAWRVLGIQDDGSIRARSTGHNGTVTLPASYTRDNVELGYAMTVNRAQGATVDTVHALVDSTTDRAAAYVALTRGRESNQVYVGLTESETRDDVLETIAAAYERDLPVHEQVEVLRDTYRSVAERGSIYADLSDHAKTAAMEHVAREALGPMGDVVIRADAWGALAFELADVTENGHDPVATLREAYHQRDFSDAKDMAAVLHWRVQGLRDRTERIEDRTAGHRPFSALSDEHLERLIERSGTLAAGMKDRELEDPNWYKRPYALVPTEQLRERRASLVKGLEVKGADDVRDGMANIDAEISRRLWLSPDQAAIEQIARKERPRRNAHGELRRGLLQEQEIRASMLPTRQQPEDDRTKITNGLSGHTANRFWAEHDFTPAHLKTILDTHHKDMGDLAGLRGRQLAADPPAWAAALGPVPANQKNALRWYRTAAEVDAFRTKYAIPDTETKAIPKAYAKSEHGAYLISQITDVHKRGALSPRPARAPEQNMHSTNEALNRQMTSETHTQAENQISQSAEARRAQFISRMTNDEVVPMTQTNHSDNHPEKETDLQKKLRELRDRTAMSRKRTQADSSEQPDHAQHQLSSDQQRQHRPHRKL